MRSAKVPIQDIFNFNVCSQCLLPFPPSVTRDVRHAVPCGHVFCKDCLGKVEAEQKSGKSVCRRAGCERELAPVSEFAISWVPQRLDRIKVKRQHMFPPQGNVGDRPLPTCSECGPDPDTGKSHLATHQCKDCGDAVYCCAELASVHPKMKATKGHVMVALAGPGASPPEAAAAAAAAAEPVWNICAQHNLPFRAVEAATHRPVCSECMFAARGMLPVETFDEAVAALETPEAAATSAEVARQKAKLAEPTFTAYELRVKTAKWCADETARIRAWEEREVKHVHTVADDTVQLVEEVCLRKLEVGASLITQRTGLRATLEEFEHALADLPSDPAARLSKKRAVHMERKQLCDLLVGSKIAVPSTHEVLRWAGYPDLSAEFDQKSADDGGSLAKTISAAAKATLGWTLKRDVLVGATVTEKKAPSTSGPNPQKGVLHVFPVIPKLDGLRSVPMNGKPNVFVGLDDDTLVIGYHEMSPLQVWDLVAGKVVRLFDGKGQWSRSMINLPRGRIATGWFTGVQSVVAIFDAKTGKQLQELIALGITSTGWRWSKITFSPCAKTRPFVFGARTLRDSSLRKPRS